MKLKNYYFVCLLLLFGSVFEGKSQSWAPFSAAWINSQGLDQGTTLYNIGCGGVVVNRLTGEATINITRFGLWKTSDQGATFERIDQEKISGACHHSAWGMQCDPENPKRMAVFSLDGKAGYTTDGVNWETWTDQGILCCFFHQRRRSG